MADEPFVRVLHPDALKDLTDTPTWERGEAYVREGRVSALRREAGSVRATVTGSEPYEVTIYVKNDRLAYQCPCPSADKGFFCKHCVAVALSWLRDGAAQLASPSGPSMRPNAKQAPERPVAPSKVRPRQTLAPEKETQKRAHRGEAPASTTTDQDRREIEAPWRPGQVHAALRRWDPTELADLLLDLAESHEDVRALIRQRLRRSETKP